MARKHPWIVPAEYFIEGRKKIRSKVLEEYGPGPHTKDVKNKINQEVRKRMERKNRARIHHLYMKIEFQRRTVRLCVPRFGYKKVSFRPSQLIKHFTPQQIRCAAAKYLKIKRRLEM
jgi:hypothetical protein